MTADLVQRFTAPADVWKQADETMVDVLGARRSLDLCCALL